MADLDKIFEKSNLDENKKKSKTIFGKLLINLRKSNRIKLYSLMSSVVETDLENNEFKLTFLDKASFDLVNNKNDIEILNSMVKEIEDGAFVSLKFDKDKVFDLYQFKERLKKDFGRILTIK